MLRLIFICFFIVSCGDQTVPDSVTIQVSQLSTEYVLHIDLQGEGLIALDDGRACNKQCDLNVVSGKTVSLTAQASMGYQFSGWSGACSGAGECLLTVEQSITLTASFEELTEVEKYSLTISSGEGGSISASGNICSETCQIQVDKNDTVELVSVPDDGYRFVSWGGACEGLSSCSVVMNSERTVSASFELLSQLVISPPTGFDMRWGIPGGSGEPPIVFWPQPIRAHPEIPFEYGIVAYDKENDEIQYSLENEPAGMTIDELGIIRWQPNIDSGVKSEFTVVVSDGLGSVRIPVSLIVDKTKFIFVNGQSLSSNSDGSLDNPFKTVQEGMRELRRLATLGERYTLIIRGGTYPNTVTELAGEDDWRRIYATPSDPIEIMGYPGEHVIIEYAPNTTPTATGYAGKGYTFDATDDTNTQNKYIYIRNLEFANASRNESGGLVVRSNHVVITRVTVRNSSWDASNNVAGFYLAGKEVVVHRSKGINNYDRDDRHYINSTNFITYSDKGHEADPGADSSVYLLHNYSEGSIIGFRNKHNGPGTVHLHGSLAVKSNIGWDGYDDGSSVRFNIFDGNVDAIKLYATETEKHAQENMDISNNTVINYQHNGILMLNGAGRGCSNIGVSLCDSDVNGFANTKIRNNIFSTKSLLANLQIQGAGHFMDFWRANPGVGDPLASKEDIDSDNNCFYAPNNDAGFYLTETPLDWAGWRALGLDINSLWVDTTVDQTITWPDVYKPKSSLEPEYYSWWRENPMADFDVLSKLSNLSYKLPESSGCQISGQRIGARN